MCAETDEIAIREAQPHIEFFFNKLLRMPQEMLLPPGYLSLASMQGVVAAKRALSSGNQTIEDVIEKGVFLCGSARDPAREAGAAPEGDRLRLSAADDAVRHAAARADAQEHRAVRQGSDPVFPRAERAEARVIGGDGVSSLSRTPCATPAAARRARARRARRASAIIRKKCGLLTLSQKPPSQPPRMSPGKVAANHRPIISESTRAGASRDTSARPTGARCSSPIVTMMK